LESNKSSVDKVGRKIDCISETLKILKEEYERFRGQIHSWEVKLRELEKECDYKDKWQKRNNMLTFGIEESPQETYFETLKMT
jgi:predicted RNase H-like nuclease (RuvC/YqgF family)